jgi:hypothetical protein
MRDDTIKAAALKECLMLLLVLGSVVEIRSHGHTIPALLGKEAYLHTSVLYMPVQGTLSSCSDTLYRTKLHLNESSHEWFKKAISLAVKSFILLTLHEMDLQSTSYWHQKNKNNLQNSSSNSASAQ